VLNIFIEGIVVFEEHHPAMSASVDANTRFANWRPEPVQK
jgi:hypothetical protein